MYQAYRARAVQVEFGESTYIALIILSLLQALFIGTPLLVMSSDNPSALYFIKAAVLFITSMAVLSLMFVPKLMHVRRQSKGGPSNKSTIKCSVGTVRISGLNVDVRNSFISCAELNIFVYWYAMSHRQIHSAFNSHFIWFSSPCFHICHSPL